MPDELVLENRMSDVVKGVYKEKVNTEASHLLFHFVGLYLSISGYYLVSYLHAGIVLILAL